MTDRSPTFQQLTFPGLDSGIFSPASEDGPTPSDSQACPTTPTCGPEAAPVSRSAQPVGGEGLPTSDTSGPRGSGSSASAALQSSLASRLRALTVSSGSTLFSLTWKERATPALRQICALRASAPRIVASDSGSWPTPTTSDSSDSARHGYADDGRPRSAQRQQRETLTGHSGTTLTDAARMAGWPTPVREDSESTGVRPVTEMRSTPLTSDEKGESPPTTRRGTGGLPTEARLASWATPVATEIGNTLENYQAMKANMKSGPRTAITHPSLQAQLTHWPTPQTDNFRSRSGDRKDEMGMDQMARTIGPARITATGAMLTGSPAETASGGQLSPAHSRWLMGYPIAWDACAPTATRSFLKSRRRSSSQPSTVSSEEDDRDAP